VETTASSRSSDSGASIAETSPVNLASSTMASLRQLRYNEAIIRSSSLFERLMSGQESVSGEVPPAYDGVGSRSTTDGVAVL
jgi:arrestin-related trafficking adapter 3/6